jgi:large subunit ribosomal protein L29
MQADEIRGLSETDLAQRLAELERERFNLRFKSGTQPLEDPLRLRHLRKDIARVRTVQQERALGVDRPVKAEADAAPTKKAARTAAAKKAPAKSAAKKTTAKKAAAKKTTAKKASAKPAAPGEAGGKKKSASKATAAKKTATKRAAGGRGDR